MNGNTGLALQKLRSFRPLETGISLEWPIQYKTSKN
jgi:hypothetical protein